MYHDLPVACLYIEAHKEALEIPDLNPCMSQYTTTLVSRSDQARMLEIYTCELGVPGARRIPGYKHWYQFSGVLEWHGSNRNRYRHGHASVSIALPFSPTAFLVLLAAAALAVRIRLWFLLPRWHFGLA